MKKIFSVILATTLLFAVGCDSSDNQSGRAKTNVEPASFAVAQSGGEEISLVENGKSDYKIVIPAQATYVEGYAAEELRDFLEESTNCRLNIITDAGLVHDNSKSYLSVGNTTLLKAQTDITIDYDTMGETGPSIHTKDRTVYMAGARDYGTLFSVYKFLEYEIAFEAFANDYVYYEPHASLPLYDFEYEYVPAVKGPVVLATETLGLKYNPNAIQEAARMYMYASGTGGIGFNGSLYAISSWTHTTFVILPPATYQAEHPDWYGNDQLCYSNEEMTQEYIKRMITKLESSPNAIYAMIGGSDLRSSCDCADCSASYSKYGGGGGIFVQFVNKVADGIKQWNPDRDITIYGLAYYAYEQPPVKQNEDGSYSPIDETVVCRPNVGMCYAPIDACYSHPFGEDACETNEVYTERFKGWAACTDHLSTYLYNQDYSDVLAYFNNWDSMVNSVPLLDEVGLDYYISTGGKNVTNPFGALRYYLHSKALWNSSYETEELVNRFMTYYYKDAASYMKEFYEIIRQQANITATVQQTECVGVYDKTMNASNWSRATYLRMLNVLENAFNAIERSSKTATEKAILQERVDKEYVIMRYQEVSDYKQYYSDEEYSKIMSEIEEKFAKYGIMSKESA